jgi:hypothetical protein
MAIKTLTIYDVPKKVRAAGAANVRKQIQQLLGNSTLTVEQRKELQGQVKWAGQWERLEVQELVAPPTPHTPITGNFDRIPQHHAISLEEAISLNEV